MCLKKFIYMSRIDYGTNLNNGKVSSVINPGHINEMFQMIKVAPYTF